MTLRTVFRNTALAALCFTLPALAAPLKTDLTKSTVSATFKQLSVPLDGKFRKFTAQIDFNVAKPETSKAAMELDISGFDLGDPEFNKEVLKKEWFNAAQFPKANFVSSSIKAGANGQFDVTGKLTIKGRAADVRFPMKVKTEGANQIFEGSLPIKRLTYAIGEGDWADTSTVADEVIIKFRIVAAP